MDFDQTTSLFGVFDGHGGEYIRQLLYDGTIVENMNENLSWHSKTNTLRYDISLHYFLMLFEKFSFNLAVFIHHIGSEVAIYAQKHLAEVIKATDSYKNGDTKQGLIEAFFKLDEDLITEEVCTDYVNTCFDCKPVTNTCTGFRRTQRNCRR